MSRRGEDQRPSQVVLIPGKASNRHEPSSFVNVAFTQAGSSPGKVEPGLQNGTIATNHDDTDEEASGGRNCKRCCIVIIVIVVCCVVAAAIAGGALFILPGLQEKSTDGCLTSELFESTELFACDNGEVCLSYNYVCNGDDDCGDNSDEQDCDACAWDEFTCINRNCISLSYVCDDNNDCGDNSDEDYCDYVDACKSYEFKCDNGYCVFDINVCDGANNCGDYSDEQDCGRDACESDEFTCDNGGGSVPEDYVCDDYDDCDDNSDEEDCGRDCPDGWSLHGSYCYRYYGNSLPWGHAEITCSGHGGHLASIHSNAENDYIKSLAGGQVVWIGLNDDTSEGSYRWSDDTSTSYTRWGSGQPDNDCSFWGCSSGDEDCTVLWGSSGYWNDDGCDESFRFICKM